MGRILVFGIIFVFVGLAVMFLFTLLFEVVAILFIAALVGAVVVGVVVTAIWLLGLFEGDDDEHIEKKKMSKSDADKRIEEMVEEELKSMKLSNEVRRDDQGRESHHGEDRAYRNVQGR